MGITYKSACSGLWYTDMLAAGMISEVRIDGLSPPEWVEYWKDGNIQFMEDGIDYDDMRQELATASALVESLLMEISAMRCRTEFDCIKDDLDSLYRAYNLRLIDESNARRL